VCASLRISSSREGEGLGGEAELELDTIAQAGTMDTNQAGDQAELDGQERAGGGVENTNQARDQAVSKDRDKQEQDTTFHILTTL